MNKLFLIFGLVFVGCTDSHNFTKITPEPELEKESFIGELGIYENQGEDLGEFNVTCLLEKSIEIGYATLKITTGEGGLFKVHKILGAKEVVELPPNSTVFLYSNRGNGLYKVTLSEKSKIKACRPL